MATTVRGRVGAGVLAWLGGIGVAVAVAHPESCPPPTPDAALAAVTEAVAWLADNQADDGRFLYRYDRDEAEVVPGYNTVRHAGTLLALEQARAYAIPGSTTAADRGIEWALDHLTELDGDRAALTADTGGTGLLVAALIERRRTDADESRDDLLAELGRFLTDTVTDDGAVVARWDLEADRPVEGTRSPFFTGEIMWALARLHAEFPEAGWDEPARRISHYLSTERDDAERRFPPVSDHWGAYAFAEIAAWPSPLSDEALAYERRQAGLFSVQLRFESQRRERGIARLTRGPVALTAGVGTIGEGLGAIGRLAEADEDLDVDPTAVAERQACVAGLLVERQAHSDDPRVDGAWFRMGVTQVDDQQHAISALLAAVPVLEDES